MSGRAGSKGGKNEKHDDGKGTGRCEKQNEDAMEDVRIDGTATTEGERAPPELGAPSRSATADEQSRDFLAALEDYLTWKGTVRG